MKNVNLLRKEADLILNHLKKLNSKFVIAQKKRNYVQINILKKMIEDNFKRLDDIEKEREKEIKRSYYKIVKRK